MADQNPASPPEVDLFGNPVEPLRDRRGRPSYKKDKENQDFVAVRAALGWTQGAIATAIGCDEKTLRKHFSRELENGHLIVQGMLLDSWMHKARQGHGPSLAKLQDRLDAIAPPAPGSAKGKAAAEPKPEHKGKKEQRLEDAARPSSDYGDLYARIHRKQ